MTTPPDFARIRYHTYQGYHIVHVDAGPRELVHVVPPAGEDCAYDRQEYARQVEVSISPTGRSVRVWVDGVEVKSGGKGHLLGADRGVPERRPVGSGDLGDDPISEGAGVTGPRFTANRSDRVWP